jgi:hypothetical protein
MAAMCWRAPIAKNVAGKGTASGVECSFLTIFFLSGRHPHVCKIYDGWSGWISFACDGRVRAIADGTQ